MFLSTLTWRSDFGLRRRTLWLMEEKDEMRCLISKTTELYRFYTDFIPILYIFRSFNWVIGLKCQLQFIQAWLYVITFVEAVQSAQLLASWACSYYKELRKTSFSIWGLFYEHFLQVNFTKGIRGLIPFLKACKTFFKNRPIVKVHWTNQFYFLCLSSDWKLTSYALEWWWGWKIWHLISGHLHSVIQSNFLKHTDTSF